MPAILDEHQSYQDTNGKPLVGGRVFFGIAGSDPTILANKIKIFSDRGLTTESTNPQPINAQGQLAVKIFVPGRYSIEVQNENDAQLFRDLDAGALASIGITALTNVESVSNNITASADPTINAYIDKAQFSLTIPVASTGSTTLDIDTVSVVPIKNKGVDILTSQFAVNQLIVVAYNAAINPPTGIFELVSGITASAPGPIGDVNPSSIDGTAIEATTSVKGATLEATTSIKAATGATITAFDTGTLDSSDTKVPTNLTVQEAITASGVLQHIITISTASVSTGFTIPSDNTIPQITEGENIMTLAITPLSTTSRLIVKAGGFGGGSSVNWAIALFKDATANAIAVAAQTTQAAGIGGRLDVVYSEISGSLTTRTFTLRFGGGTGTGFFGQTKNSNTYGGIAKGSIDIVEVAV